MEFEDKIKNKLLMRGFPNEKLLNNRGLIGATIDEVILLTVKNLSIPDVSNCDPYIHNTAIQFGGKCGKCGRSEKI